jgi:fructokinase
MSALPLVGGIEAGGTKVVCAIGTGPGDVRAESRIPTTTPPATIAAALAFFRAHAARAPILALGIASFGPIDLARESPSFGSITTTPKPGWAGTDLAGPFARALGLPVAFDTDVNGAALAEHRWGAGRGLDPFVYLTVGTGVGGGAIVNGRLVHGLLHPEMGHVRVPHDRSADPFPGLCPHHGDCLEGLASGPAMEARWSTAPESLAEHHPAWALEADYLAHGLVALVSILSPRRIAVGGGVASPAHVLPRVRARLTALLAGYIRAPELLDHMDRYVVPPSLGERSGVLGALALAHDLLAGAR